jgi:16S rRNA (adenine1518-N6/adenine1519-N6)-dimethyltransferase
MKNSHRPIKSLGQNFLDSRIQQRIVKSCELKEDDAVIEIGPGKGAMTKELLNVVKRVIAVEKDHSLVSFLKEQHSADSLEVIDADFLKWDMGSLPNDLVVVGNIPYYISTAIIEKLIHSRGKIQKAFLTVQLEFAQRLAAKAGNKDYGSLSCFVQYYFDVKIMFKINKGSFNPVPKVDSCFVSLIPKPSSELRAKNEERLFKMIQIAFMQRRKTLINTLKGIVSQEQLLKEMQRLKINSKARPEEISLLNYVELSNSLMI